MLFHSQCWSCLTPKWDRSWWEESTGVCSGTSFDTDLFSPSSSTLRNRWIPCFLSGFPCKIDGRKDGIKRFCVVLSWDNFICKPLTLMQNLFPWMSEVEYFFYLDLCICISSVINLNLLPLIEAGARSGKRSCMVWKSEKVKNLVAFPATLPSGKGVTQEADQISLQYIFQPVKDICLLENPANSSLPKILECPAGAFKILLLLVKTLKIRIYYRLLF